MTIQNFIIFIHNNILINKNYGGAYPEIHIAQLKYLNNNFSLQYDKSNLLDNKKNQFNNFIMPSKINAQDIKQYFKKLLKFKYSNGPLVEDNLNQTRYFRVNNKKFTQIYKITDIINDPLQPCISKIKKKIYFEKSNNISYVQIKKNNKIRFDIPKAISNWKNSRGFTIPITKRIKNDYILTNNNFNTTKFSSIANVLEISQKIVYKKITNKGPSS